MTEGDKIVDNRTYGYARVSSADQNESRQVEALLSFGVERRNIKIDRSSGKDFNRKAYLSLIGTEEVDGALREGDLLVVLSIDRLGRNYSEITEQWRHITKVIKADIMVLDMPLLDTRQNGQNLDSRFVADLVLQIISYVAQKERESIKTRQKQGIDVMPVVDGKKVSIRTGKPHGRPKAEYPANWVDVYTKWKAGELTAVNAFDTLQLTKNTFYNLVRRYEQQKNVEKEPISTRQNRVQSRGREG